ncbi:MAG: radical SAM protein, partial [Dehalococcoidales bacterium]|nr:radical SAM protein [Dehalococcoidales bacterium]
IFAKKHDKVQVTSASGEAAHSQKTGYQDVKNAALYEPRIELIKTELESLLSVVNLEREGKAVEVDGFRLKDLRDWLVPSAGDPIEIFGYAGARCDADCIFCYNNGNPSSLSLSVLRRSPAEESEEMMTRLKYFSPAGGLSLFPSLGSIYEVLAHPRIFEVLRQLREKTPAVFRIATNGTRLTPETISRLAALPPVYLYLSLNSASPVRRRKLMKDKKSQVAIDALPLLREKGIPYATVIVPWPFDSLAATLEDL